MHFFELEDGLVEKPLGYTYYYYEDDDDDEVADAVHCPVCDRPMGSLQAVPPIRVCLETHTKKFGDVAFGPGDQILVSERFKRAYEARNMRGLEAFNPAEVLKHSKKRKMADEPMPAYYHCPIVRSRAKYDQVASEFVWENPDNICEDCCYDRVLHSYERLVLIPETWEGHDIFYARGCSGPIVVTERFKQMFEDEGLTGELFIDLADAGWNEFGDFADFWPPPPP